MAAERAETMATTIHASCRHAGRPPAASMAPQSAKGSAKIECSHLIISSVIFRFRRKGTGYCKAAVDHGIAEVKGLQKSEVRLQK